MRRKKVCLVIDLRDGENISRVPEMAAILAAAGWKIDLVLKEFGGTLFAHWTLQAQPQAGNQPQNSSARAKRVVI